MLYDLDEEHCDWKNHPEVHGPKSVTKRFKETRLAASANREYMMQIERCGIPYAEFAEMALDAMKDFEY